MTTIAISMILMTKPYTWPTNLRTWPTNLTYLPDLLSWFLSESDNLKSKTVGQHWSEWLVQRTTARNLSWQGIKINILSRHPLSTILPVVFYVVGVAKLDGSVTPPSVILFLYHFSVHFSDRATKHQIVMGWRGEHLSSHLIFFPKNENWKLIFSERVL